MTPEWKKKRSEAAANSTTGLGLLRLFGDDLILDLVVGGLRNDLLTHKFIFPLVGRFSAIFLHKHHVAAVLFLVSAACTQAGEDPIRVNSRTARINVLSNFIRKPPL
jgi:hypothetical protein